MTQITLNPEHRLEGYSMKDPDVTARRNALLQAIDARYRELVHDGAIPTKKCSNLRANAILKVQRRVTVLATFFKYSHPEYANVAEKDAEFLRKIRESMC